MGKKSNVIGGIRIVGGSSIDESKPKEIHKESQPKELKKKTKKQTKKKTKKQTKKQTKKKSKVDQNVEPTKGIESPTTPLVGRKPTRKERRRAKAVAKQNEVERLRKEKQVELFRKGKVSTKEVLYDDRSIWSKMLGDKTYNQFKEMGDSEEAISSFQKKRVLVSLAVLLVGGIIGFLLHPIVAGVGFVVALLAYIMKARSVDAYYKNWKFERQLAFSKFTRLVIPYLKSSDGNMALYTIFNRIIRRMEDPEDKRNLYQLMGEMGEDPTNIQPFLDFAERSSGTDMSHLFMTTIFDFQQTTFDVTVIDELGKLASEDMMESVDEIIAFKLQRFAMFPTKIVMSSFLLVAGLAVGMMIFSFKGLNFGTDDLNIETAPQPQTEVDEELDEVIEEDLSDDDMVFVVNGHEWS